MSTSPSTATPDTATHTETKQIVVFELDGEEYGAPIGAVKEVIKTMKITVVPNSQDFILGVINLRGKIVAILDIERLFGLARDDKMSQEHIVITESDQGSLFGLQVDTVSEILKVTNDMIQPTPKLVASKISADFVSGVLVIADGPTAQKSDERVILLLDIQKIVAEKVLTQLQEAAASQPDEQNDEKEKQ